MLYNILSILVVGIIVGLLGRLILPGRQNIGLWLTLLVGVVAALLGTLVAGVFGVADTSGIDWIKLIFQVAFAAVGVALVDRMRGSRAINR